MSKKVKTFISRNLRKNLTLSEHLLWQRLRRKDLGHKFRCQHLAYGYILDFYCPKLKLGIEVDGKIHDKQKEQDQERENILQSKGIKIIRFTGAEVIGNIEKVITKLNKFINK